MNNDNYIGVERKCRPEYITKSKTADYNFLKKDYPNTVSKEQFRLICHIGKSTAKYYIDNDLIPCVALPKITHRYKIKLNDIIKFLEDRDANPEKYYLPKYYSNPFLPSYKRQQEKRRGNGLYANVHKLKSMKEVPDYKKYLLRQFKEYPDMMTTLQLRQLTGYSLKTILTWCSANKVRFLLQGHQYYIQKQSVISYLYEREKQK